MAQSSGVILWKRAWRTSDGVVFSTRPYATEEDLLKSEPADGRWCGDPFSFVADDFALADFERCEANDRKRQELFDSQNGMCACCGEPLERSFNMQPVTPPRLVRIECVRNGSALLHALP
ncbi:hypothetical protein [Nitrosovibrio sp. Nv4]|uniref:hypothetical protein n=1 Tax=Nitrosovibrio sp. Nv4 TaxID=1945880 RepID=UPI000BC90FB8|nr:hypothetical protein [Nitrosovibrio sp. Nv4]SOD42385.1 hypothetical protein SAMN06298226_2724 [Nitrosovibrio sp. Nv4]